MTIRSIWIIAGIVVLGLCVALFLPKPPEEHQEQAPPQQSSTPTEKPTITDIRVGKGRVAEPGDMVTVHYELFLPNGRKVQSSRDEKKPFRFLLGGGVVMPGWDLGMPGARVGTVRRLVVPPSLGYGSRGSEDGKIPPNTTLTFVVEVLNVEKPEDDALLDPLLKPLQNRQKSGTPGR